MTKDKPIILVDGSSYLYRAFHGLPPLVNSKGQPTGAVYGVINMLRRLIEDYRPEHFIVVFDAKGKTFRDDMYAEYKANRPAMPDELRSQIEPLHKIVKLMGIPLLCIDGVEADDVIGTIAHQASQNNHHVLISTGDKDLAQLVNDKVTLINTMTNKIMDPDAVIEKFGIPAELIIDYLALIGDTSDNIPGIPKVGPKTAVKWLLQYGSLDNIIKHAEEFTGKVGENLRDNLEQLELSKQLVTIKLDVQLEEPYENHSLKAPDKQSLREIYKGLEFKFWLHELEKDNEAPKPETKNYQIILTKAALNEWTAKLKTADLIAFDTETTSLDYMQAKIVGVSFAVQAGEACYIPFAHHYENAPQQLSEAEVFEALKPILEDENKKKVGHNLKYDAEVLLNHGITLNGIVFDTMLESYVHNSVGSRHDMDTLALKYLNKSTIKYEDIAGKGIKQVTFDQIALEEAAPYAAEDADIALQLHQYFYSRLEKTKTLQHIYQNVEIPLIPSLVTMERTGVLIDAALLAKQSEELHKRINDIQDEVFSLAGSEFNLNSPTQLQEILYDKLKLPVLKKTPKGQPSTAEPVLKELALDYPLPKLIMEHRQLSKLKSTYTDQLPEQIDPQTGRVHTSYHQAVTATGRLSSSTPNLQNIPIKTEQGRRIRKAFIAPDNYKILAADYSQIELRIMAHLSGDKGLLSAFEQGKDIHQATAAEIFNIELDKVESHQRRNAKAINFGLIYGMSAFGLARQLNIERSAAQNYIERYFERYPGVKHYMDKTREQAHELGYVETLFGRRLYLPLINTRNKMQQLAAERTAINAPMQGTAADIIKMAMTKVHHWLNNTKVNAKMIMQVHDELVFEVHHESIEKISTEIRTLMESAAKLDTPLIVDIGIGENWDEAH